MSLHLLEQCYILVFTVTACQLSMVSHDKVRSYKWRDWVIDEGSYSCEAHRYQRAVRATELDFHSHSSEL